MKNSRYFVLYACLFVSLAGAPFAYFVDHFVWLWLLAVALTIVGITDLVQGKQAVRKNYPIMSHVRYIMEAIRPEVRQYLIESDEEKLPFSRSQRSLVYARSKNEPSEKAFGTIVDVYEPGFEFIGHSMSPAKHINPESFRITIGGPQCKLPYSASIFNISAMSFGALSANAIRALNRGASLGDFAHDTGEGSISPYHKEYQGALVWQLGSGLFGCRDPFGKFCPSRFAEQAQLTNVSMVSVKLSQGAKPGHGGILPAAKVTEEIAVTRGVKMGEDCISPASHSSFTNPIELLQFIQQLRELSGGKPIGFKLCLGQPWEFMGIAKAMLETGILPDFIIVDGKEGGTGAAPKEFTDHIGMPLREGLMFVHNTLVGLNLRDKIKIGASGKIISSFDIASIFALGADWVNSARGFMFALGCLQAQSCGSGKCPTGVATQDPIRQKALDVTEKSNRVYNYHKNTLIALSEMLAAAGIDHPSQITADLMVRRVSSSEIRMFSELHFFMKPGALLNESSGSDFYDRMWLKARADSFRV
ncbi:FMN-binding glutamate synthase family protein [Pseudomonas syringae pv. actinidiae]|nr:FMN-binding glutamate synthase family protein [Pseudomonas syringae pv. actinidiae]